MWYYRKLILWLSSIYWSITKVKPKYKVGQRVKVKIHTLIHGYDQILCRIREVNYRYGMLTYDIITLSEDIDHIPFGTRTYVCEDNIV